MGSPGTRPWALRGLTEWIKSWISFDESATTSFTGASSTTRSTVALDETSCSYGTASLSFTGAWSYLHLLRRAMTPLTSNFAVQRTRRSRCSHSGR